MNSASFHVFTMDVSCFTQSDLTWRNFELKIGFRQLLGPPWGLWGGAFWHLWGVLGKLLGAFSGRQRAACGPGCRQEAPRGPQESPRHPQKAARIAPETPKGRQKSARRPPKDSKMSTRKLQREVGSKNYEKFKNDDPQQ